MSLLYNFKVTKWNFYKLNIYIVRYQNLTISKAIFTPHRITFRADTKKCRASCEQQRHRTWTSSHTSNIVRLSKSVRWTKSHFSLVNIFFVSEDSSTCSILLASDIWRSTFEIDAAQPLSVTEIAPITLFLIVKKALSCEKSPIQYGFLAGARAFCHWVWT